MNKEDFLSFSVSELARKAEINKGTLSKYFSPNNPEMPTWKNIEKMANSWQVSAEKVIELIKARRIQNYENLAAKVADAKQRLLETA